MTILTCPSRPSRCDPAVRRQAFRRRPGIRRELLLLAVLYAGYSVSRFVVGADPDIALSNARAVLDVERLLQLDVEADAIDWVVGSTAGSVVAGYLYALLHYTVTPAVLVWLYRVHPAHYRRARTVLVGATCVALVCYWLVPTAPPRLLSPEFPDVLALTADYGWWGTDASAPKGLGSLTNEYAALPSMHVGWAVWAGGALALLARRRWLRLLGVAYPVVITVVVVLTGNHWVLDAVAGGVVVLAGALLLHPRGSAEPAVADRVG